MRSRPFQDSDYEMVASWWEDWGWPAIPKEFLSKNGVIVSNGGVDVCAGWLYSTDSAASWAENYISDKCASKKLRKGSLEFLVECLADKAKELGFLAMISSVKNKSLIEKLKSSNFGNEETGMTNLTRVL